MELNIKEQEAKLKAEAQRIGEELNVIQQQTTQLQQKQQVLVNEALKKQGALELLQEMEKDEV